MALTVQSYVGDGSAPLLNVDFDLGYIRQEFVYVYLTANGYTNQVNYHWTSPTSTQIQVDDVIPDGVAYEMRRIVPRDELVNDYTDGAILRKTNLNNSFRQALCILQEIEDGYSSVDGPFTLLNNLDMLGNKIVNLADGEDPQDAVTVIQLNSVLESLDVSAVTPLVAPRATADGVLNAFNSPATKYTSENAFLVNLDGVSQRPVTDFTVDAAGRVIFIEVPEVGTQVDITLYQPVVVDNMSVTPVAQPRFVANGVQDTFNMSTSTYTPEEAYQVSLDGVTQRPRTDYTINELGNLVLTEVPEVGTLLDVVLFQPNIQPLQVNGAVTALLGTTETSVAFSVFESDTNYKVLLAAEEEDLAPRWANKTASGFTIKHNAPAADRTVDWVIVR